MSPLFPSSTLRRLRAAFGSLKLRVTLGAGLAVALGIGLTTVLLVRQAERDTLSAMRDREEVEAVRNAATLSRRVVDLQRALGLTGAQIDAAMMRDEAALGRFLRSQPVLIELFNGVFIADLDGQVRMAYDNRRLGVPGVRIGDREYFRRAVREGRPVVSEPMPSRIDGAPLVLFAQPLVDAGRPVGVLVGAIQLTRRDLLALGAEDGRPGSGDVLRVVTDGHGQILAHPDPALVMASLASEPRLAAAFRRWQALGAPVEPAGLTLSERVNVVSAGGVAGPDWMVWRATSEDDLLAPLHAARRQALVWAAVITGVCCLLMLGGLHLLLLPLRRLTDRAQHLFDPGRDPAAGWPGGHGEIGSLGRVLRRVGLERARLELDNSALLRRLASVMGNAPVGIAFTRDQRFELVSAEFCRLLGRREAELLGERTATIYDSAADFAAMGPKVATAFANGEAYVTDVPMRRADGSRFWAHLRGRPVDPADSDAGTIWTVTDVTREVAARTQLEWSANHDGLTGLANRQGFERRAQRLFDTRPGSLLSAVVMIDLDHFKPVNDGAGHAAGDAMLQAVAAALRGRVRTRDLAVRLGGDEFALLLDHCPPDAALQIAEDVRAAIAAIALEWQGTTLRISASLGVASLHAGVESVAAWLRRADEACYQAKAAGRDRVCAAPVPASPARPALRVVSGPR